VRLGRSAERESTGAPTFVLATLAALRPMHVGLITFRREEGVPCAVAFLTGAFGTRVSTRLARLVKLEQADMSA
jgi:hypothetical protein